MLGIGGNVICRCSAQRSLVLAPVTRSWQSCRVDEDLEPTGETAVDGVPSLARILDVPVELLREAIGGPWNGAENAPYYGHEVTVFTGLANPRQPDRVLVVIRVDHDDCTLHVGRAIGVPVPGGKHQWSLGEPRTALEYGEIPLDETWGPQHARSLVLDELRDAVNRVLDAVVLRGTTW